MTPPIRPEDASAFVDYAGNKLDYQKMLMITSDEKLMHALPPEIQQSLNSVLGEVRYRNLTGNKNAIAADAEGRGHFELLSMLDKDPGLGLAAADMANIPEGARAVMEGYTAEEKQAFAKGFSKAYSQSQKYVYQQFAHDVTAGVVPGPEIPTNLQTEFKPVKVMSSLVAMGLHGALTMYGLGLISKVPAAGAIIENLGPKTLTAVREAATARNAAEIANGTSQIAAATGTTIGDVITATTSPFIRRISEGAIVGATVTALDPDSDHSAKNLLIQAGWGAALGEAVLGIGKGIQAAGTLRRSLKFTPEIQEAVRQSLADVNVAVPAKASRYTLAKLYQENAGKVLIQARMAGIESEQSARETLIANQIFGSKTIEPMSEDARFLAAIHQSNPGTVTVANGIFDVDAIDNISTRMGVKLETVKIKRAFHPVQGPEFEGLQRPGGLGGVNEYDVLISRPKILFGDVESIPKATRGRAKTLSRILETEGRPEEVLTESYLLPDGEAVRGGVDMAKIRRRLDLPPLRIGGVDAPDVALREATGAIKMNLVEQQLTVDIPSKITNQQANSLSRFVDQNNLDAVTFRDPGGKVVTIKNPNSFQVQDALTDMTGAKTESTITKEIVEQYKQQGVFKGQAALTEIGLPVRVLKRVGKYTTVEDPLRGGTKLRFENSKLTLIPSALEGQLKPSNLFLNYLSPEDRAGFAKLRGAIMNRLATKISDFKDLEKFAATNGFLIRRGTGAEIHIIDPTGAKQQVRLASRNAAIAWLEKNIPAAPDLTPPEITQMLGGETNIGMILPTNHSSAFGEVTPVSWEKVKETLLKDSTGPTGVAAKITPTPGLMKVLQNETGLPFYTVFNNVKQATVLRQNFVSQFAHGRGLQLPPGIMPLEKIVKLAGHNPNTENITHWLEAVDKDAAAKLLKPEELAAAKELRKWYDHLFKTFGVPADYLENYAPHWRLFGKPYGNDVRVTWAITHNTPMPKGADFFADYIRNGQVDIYDMDAFRVAANYLQKGASNRYMTESLDQATQFLKMVKSRHDAIHLANYIEALRGFEFFETKVELEATLKAFMHSIPGMSEKQAGTLAGNLLDLGIGMGYTQALAYRIPSFLRNLGQVFQTTYALSGLSGGRFSEALGRALTTVGRDEAIAAGAINIAHGAVPYRLEVERALDLLPKWKRFTELGFRLYDNADHFTRAASFHTFKMQAEDAIAWYGKELASTAPGNMAALREKFVERAGAYMFDKPVVDEFLRRVAIDPAKAAEYLGVQASDFTQFVYGRGMQPSMIRSPMGKLFGQFGSWPLSFIDFQKRTFQVLVTQNKNIPAYMQFLGRQAIVAYGIYHAGEKTGIDFGRWYAHPALFYSGGPAFPLVVGAAQVIQGANAYASLQDGPYADQKMAEGWATIAAAGKSYIPFGSFVKDLGRAGAAIQNGQGNEFMAAILGGRVRDEFYLDQILQGMQVDQPLSPEEWMRYKGTDLPQMQPSPPQRPMPSVGSGPQLTPARVGVSISGPVLSAPLKPLFAPPKPEENTAESKPIKQY